MRNKNSKAETLPETGSKILTSEIKEYLTNLKENYEFQEELVRQHYIQKKIHLVGMLYEFCEYLGMRLSSELLTPQKLVDEAGKAFYDLHASFENKAKEPLPSQFQCLHRCSGEDYEDLRLLVGDAVEDCKSVDRAFIDDFAALYYEQIMGLKCWWRKKN
jgi:hypothetical protein